MKKSGEFKGRCPGCGTEMTLKGWRDSHELPAPSAIVRKEFVAARRRLGKSLRDVEAETGVSNGTLSQFENARVDITASNLDRIIEWMLSAMKELEPLADKAALERDNARLREALTEVRRAIGAGNFVRAHDVVSAVLEGK